MRVPWNLKRGKKSLNFNLRSCKKIMRELYKWIKFLPGIARYSTYLARHCVVGRHNANNMYFPPQKIEPPATVYNHTILSIRAFELTNKIILRRNKKSKHSTTTVPRVNKHRGRQLLCTQLYAIQYYYYFCSTYDPWLPPISLRLLLHGDGMLIPAD